jgi:hypothetical protein
MKCYGTNRTVTDNGDAKNVTGLPEIFDVKASGKGSLDVNKPCTVVAEKDDVINVDSKICNEVGLAKNVTTGVAAELTKLMGEEKFMKGGIPLEWGLFQPIYGLLE